MVGIRYPIRLLNCMGTFVIIMMLVACSSNDLPEIVNEQPLTELPPTATSAPEPTVSAGIGEHTSQSVELTVDGETAVYEYYLYLPEDYLEQESWPLIIFLHGANSRGDNILRVLNQSFTISLGDNLQPPAIVISPQAPNGTYWDERIPILEALLTAVSEQYTVDPNRIYLTGFSMGGFGTWSWGIENPDLFAAIVPVAGGYLSMAEDVCVLKDTPVWAFASTADEIVAGSRTEILVDALKACGSEQVKLTLYDDANHGETGTRPYLPDSDLYPWLWEQSLATETSVAGIGQHLPQSIELTVDGQTKTQAFYLYLPADYLEQESWPLVVFLHGADRRGDDISIVRGHSFAKILGDELQVPAIVVSPQAANDTKWDDLIPDLEAFLDAIEDQYAVDSSRIYLTGFSMGGFGTWAWALQNPDRFAALVPVAGGLLGNTNVPDNICDLKDTAVWGFVSTADVIVPVRRTVILIDALKECGAKEANITIYDDVTHRDIGTVAYLPTSDFYPWLWKQSRPVD